VPRLRRCADDHRIRGLRRVLRRSGSIALTVIRIPPTLRDTTGGEREIDGTGSTLRDLLENVNERYPSLGARVWDDGQIARFVYVFVGGEDARTLQGLETPVDDSTTVILLPAMAGGNG
jgi:molybdopterin converting factor small subunit